MPPKTIIQYLIGMDKLKYFQKIYVFLHFYIHETICFKLYLIIFKKGVQGIQVILMNAE